MGRPGRFLIAGALFLAHPVPAFAQPLGLTHPPDLAHKVEALPRLVATTRSMERINAELARMDRAARDDALACNSDPPRSFVARWVTVEFAGPHYFALLVGNEFYCPGAAHGAHFAAPVVFDLETGSQVDWPSLFPAALQDQVNRPHRSDYVIGSPGMTDLYLSHAVTMDQECREEILAGNGGYFHIWPSAKDRGLVLLPTGLPYSSQACADPVVFPVTLLRSEGFPDKLISALSVPLPMPPPQADTP